MPNKRWVTRVELAALLDDAWNMLKSDPQCSIEQLAGKLGLSQYHFTRCFQERYGETPRQFATAAKWESIRHEIVATTLPVNEVALRHGIHSASTFCRQFKAKFGCSPLSMRAKPGQ